MNPFLWLLFVLAAALVLAVAGILAAAVVKAWRDLPAKSVSQPGDR